MGDLLNNISSRLNAEQLEDLNAFIRAERCISNVLSEQGHTVLAHNYFVHKLGEIDIITKKDGVLYAVEVKARQVDDQFGGPAAQFTHEKQQRVIKTLKHYASYQNQYDIDMQLLAATVEWDENNNIVSHNIFPWELY